MDTRVRIRIYHPNGDWSYFVRLNERNRPEVEANHESVHAALMTRDTAFSFREKLRAAGWPCDIVTPRGDVLFADGVSQKKGLLTEERVPVAIDGILIRPASANRWCVKFPDHHNRETLYGTSVEEVFGKVQAFNLMSAAEKFVAPPAPPEPTQTNTLPPGVRYRPGSL